MVEPQKNIQFIQYSAGKVEPASSPVIVEKPVSLTVNGEVWLTWMCTPVDLEAMAAGFLFNEGIINTKEEIATVRACPSGDNVDVWLNHAAERPEHWRRTSGCTGGVTSVEGEGRKASDHPHNGLVLSTDQVTGLVAALFEAQELYRKSGGVHTSALSDGRSIRLAAEDIGRHNTLDKLAGHLLLEQPHIEPRVLLTTGRISSEMLQKAARMGAAIVISRTSPSTLSIEMAERWGITLIGYARRTRFILYTHPARIDTGSLLPAFSAEPTDGGLNLPG